MHSLRLEAMHRWPPTFCSRHRSEAHPMIRPSPSSIRNDPSNRIESNRIDQCIHSRTSVVKVQLYSNMIGVVVVVVGCSSSRFAVLSMISR